MLIRDLCIHCVSTRSVDDLVQAMGGTSISDSAASRRCEEYGERVSAFLNRPFQVFGRIRRLMQPT